MSNNVFQSGRPDGLIHVWITDACTGKEHKVYLRWQDANWFGGRLVQASQEAKFREERGKV